MRTCKTLLWHRGRKKIHSVGGILKVVFNGATLSFSTVEDFVSHGVLLFQSILKGRVKVVVMIFHKFFQHFDSTKNQDLYHNHLLKGPKIHLTLINLITTWKKIQGTVHVWSQKQTHTTVILRRSGFFAKKCRCMLLFYQKYVCLKYTCFLLFF